MDDFEKWLKNFGKEVNKFKILLYKMDNDIKIEKEIYSAIDISNYIIDKCNKENIFINNLKLNKLLYFVQKEHLKKYNRILFIEELLPYRYGASVENVYRVFKYYGRDNINEPIDKLINIEEESKEIIDSIILKYRNCKSMEMVILSRKEESYKKAIKEKSNIIKIEWIKES